MNSYTASLQQRLVDIKRSSTGGLVRILYRTNDNHHS